MVEDNQLGPYLAKEKGPTVIKILFLTITFTLHVLTFTVHIFLRNILRNKTYYFFLKITFQNFKRATIFSKQHS